MLTAIEAALDELCGDGGDFPLTEVVVHGQRYRAFRDTPASLRAYFDRALQQGDLPFLVHGEERWSFAEGHRAAARLATALTETLGVGKGDRVAIAMRNYPEWIFAFMAITASGAIAVPMNAWWTGEEFAFALRDSGARLCLADGERLARIAPHAIRADVGLVAVRAGDEAPAGAIPYQSLLSGGAAAFPQVPIAPDDDAILIYTSGSSGRPKGVVSTHRAVLSVMMMWAAAARARRIVAERSGVALSAHQPCSLMTVPLFHVTASHAIFLLSFAVGRKIVLMRRWDAREALRLIERERVTSFSGVPTMSWELLNAPDIDRYDLSSLSELGSGGAPRPVPHVALLKRRFANAAIASGYGLTETNAAGAINSGDSYLERPGSTGKPTRPLIEMRIVGPGGGPLPAGQVGEICIRSVANFRGYWNDPEATAAAVEDGWFRTGDLGRFDDDGYLYIVDRAKDIVIRGGENISCVEVEDVLYRHPDVFEAAVFGVPDERLGEVTAAVLVPRPGRRLQPEALKAFVGEHLAAFKVPSEIWIRHDPLPRTGSGKLFKRRLREEILSRAGEPAGS